MTESEIDLARAWIGSSRRPLVLTGAGVSAESGIPTFRGAGGLWRDHRPEDLATPEAFARDPRLVWSFYSWRRAKVRTCRPNAAHDAVARLERSHPDAWLVTQNVDGLHRLAGSTRVVEIHGNLMTDRCNGCDRTRPAVAADEGEDGPPTCDACGGRWRPAVVWFGEPVTEIEGAFALADQCDLAWIVGTSGAVEPAASVARVAAANGAKVIEVNPEPSMLSAIADVSIRGTAAAVVPQLVESP